MNSADFNGEATLFWRLAALRVQAERVRAELEQLREALGDPEDAWDMVNQLAEAAQDAAELVDYLTPEPGHQDRKLQSVEARP